MAEIYIEPKVAENSSLLGSELYLNKAEGSIDNVALKTQDISVLLWGHPLNCGGRGKTGRELVIPLYTLLREWSFVKIYIEPRVVEYSLSISF